MHQSWIAFLLVSVTAFVGCSSDPEPVAEVPSPTYQPEPEPLPPVSINEGSTVEPGTVTLGPGAGSSTYEPEPLPPAQPEARTYTIKKGDTFIGLARRLYGNEAKWKDIAQANPSLDPRKLKIGQQIVLP